MRLSELLKVDAYDSTGADIGHVRDVRLERKGDHWEVTGLVVGSGALADRLGYAYGVVAGPRIIAMLMSWLARHGKFVPWRVVRLGDGRVDVDARGSDLRHPNEQEP